MIQKSKKPIHIKLGGGWPSKKVWCNIHISLMAFNYYGFVYNHRTGDDLDNYHNTYAGHVPPCDRKTPQDTTAILQIHDNRLNYLPLLEIKKGDTLIFGKAQWLVKILNPPTTIGTGYFGYIELELLHKQQNP